MKMSKSLKHHREHVLRILRLFEQARDSDKLLWLQYMCEHAGLASVLGDKYQDFASLFLSNKTPSLESLGRVRRKLQEDGYFRGKNRDKRMQEESEVRKMIKHL